MEQLAGSNFKFEIPDTFNFNNRNNLFLFDAQYIIKYDSIAYGYTFHKNNKYDIWFDFQRSHEEAFTTFRQVYYNADARFGSLSETFNDTTQMLCTITYNDAE